MTDLRERFDEYRQVEVPDLWDRIEDLATTSTLQPTPTPRRRPLLVALAAFVAVLVAAAGFLIARTDPEPAPTGTQPPPTTAPTNQITEPIPTTDAWTVGGWTRWPSNPEVFMDGYVNDVAAGGPGWVAVGSFPVTCDGPGVPPCTGAVWISDDAIGWERVGDDAGLFADLDSVRALAAGSNGLVAVGEGRGGGALAWFSPNGIDWTRTVLSDVGQGEQAWDVAAFDDGYVAVGNAPGPQWRAAIWISPDGIDWNQIDLPPGVVGNGFPSAIAVTDAGLVAVGPVEADTGFGVWTSTDAITWTERLIPAPIPGPIIFTDLAVGADGLVAAGSSVMGGLYYSPDGVIWQRPTPNFMARSVVSVGDGFLAGGYECGDSGCTTMVWTSTNGSTWIPLDTPEGFFDGEVTTLRSAGPGLVAFSILYSGPGESAGVGHWTWTS